jgi:PilZ domain
MRQGMAMSVAMLVERRAATRHRSYKSGKLVFNDNKSVLDCIIRNLSQAGALLEIPAVATVPEEFDLHADGGVRRCKVLWRRPNRMGIKFL